MSGKIGILTFHNGPNYGGYMQAWHVRHAIEQLGYRCAAVNYLHPLHLESNKVKVPLRSIGDLKARIHWGLKRWPFRHLGDGLCDTGFVASAERVAWSDYDRVVVGSDVVWDFENPVFGHDPCYFGAAPGQDRTEFVSYAASCGSADTEGPLPEYCGGLRRFLGFGVRDEATRGLVRRVTGRDSVLVVDPTWLNPDPEVSWWRAPRSRYVLVYGPGLTGETSRQLSEWCRERGFRLINAASICPTADRTYRMLSPFQWVDLFRRAEAVVAGTFHGTLFAMKYGKPFVLLNNRQARQKVKAALARTGMEFRCFEPAEFGRDQLALLDPATAALPVIPAAWVAESKAYLAAALAADSAGAAESQPAVPRP